MKKHNFSAGPAILPQEVIQGAAVVTLVLNLVAMWRQENILPNSKAEIAAPRPKFVAAWKDFISRGNFHYLTFL